ncbi:MAG: lipopolysaccharide biosynthesis protein [Gammaproteobacteria bacterium]|nr:lipopolysaccharide biosynthesis protein [Gammaproteobacteria bacterium]
MYEPAEYTFQDYLDIWRRRKRTAIKVGGTLLLVTLLTVLLWPAIYQSTATILIEQQEIPEDLVRSLAQGYPDQRIQVISQRVMTSTNLIDIMNRHDLYSVERRREPLEVVVEMMRDDIELEPVNADVVDPRSGRAGQATIAFTLGYENESPDRAQAVANELVSLFMQENLKSRTESAQEASNFLADEADKLGQQVSDLERQLADFKSRNINALPEFAQLNLELRAASERELMEIDRQIRSYEQQQILLDAELARTDPGSNLVVSGNQVVLGPEDQLRVLKTNLVALTARYGPKHPDIINVKRQVQALEANLGQQSTYNELSIRLDEVRAALAEATKRYSPDHPDVQQLQKIVATMEAGMKNSPAAQVAALSPNDADGGPTNPAYLQLKVRQDTIDQELNTLRDKRGEVRRQLDESGRVIAQTPEVERELRVLTRDYQNALQKYQDVTAKRMEADVSRSLEREQKGERFSLIEPPLLPEEPDKPNRWAIFIIGLLLSLASGVGAVALVETMDGAVHGGFAVAAVTGAAPLGTIPLVDAIHARPAQTMSWVVTGVIAFAVVALLLLLFHFNVMPLDVAVYSAMRRMSF